MIPILPGSLPQTYRCLQSVVSLLVDEALLKLRTIPKVQANHHFISLRLPVLCVSYDQADLLCLS